VTEIIMSKLIVREKDNFLSRLKQYSPAIIVFLCLFSLFAYELFISSQSEEIVLSSSIDSIVEHKYSIRNDLSIKLRNREKRIIISNTRNCENDPSDLSDFLEVNDLIIKNKCSDTLYVVRENKRVYFLIEDGCYNCDNISKKQWQIWNQQRSILNERNDCK
jgi:hypothetical protein